MLAQRIITGLVFGVAITAALLLASTPIAAAVLGLLWLAGAWEWAGFARLLIVGRCVYTSAIAAAMLLCWLFIGQAWLNLLLILALAWWCLAFALVLTFPRRVGGDWWVAAAGGVVLVPSWALLVRLHGDGALGAALAFTVLLVVWAADVGAYFAGRWLGRTKLAPAVSPGKTWEGLAGGLLLAAAAAGAAASWLGLPVLPLVVLGVGTALVSVLGDLTQSVFKRNVGLKDSGVLLPGHGGVLDRIDSLTAAVPAFVFGLAALGLGG